MSSNNEVTTPIDTSNAAKHAEDPLAGSPSSEGDSGRPIRENSSANPLKVDVEDLKNQQSHASSQIHGLSTSPSPSSSSTSSSSYSSSSQSQVVNPFDEESKMEQITEEQQSNSPHSEPSNKPEVDANTEVENPADGSESGSSFTTSSSGSSSSGSESEEEQPAGDGGLSNLETVSEEVPMMETAEEVVQVEADGEQLASEDAQETQVLSIQVAAIQQEAEPTLDVEGEAAESKYQEEEANHSDSGSSYTGSGSYSSSSSSYSESEVEEQQQVPDDQIQAEEVQHLQEHERFAAEQLPVSDEAQQDLTDDQPGQQLIIGEDTGQQTRPLSISERARELESLLLHATVVHPQPCEETTSKITVPEEVNARSEQPSENLPTESEVGAVVDMTESLTLHATIVGVDNNEVEEAQQESITTEEQQPVDDASNEQGNLLVTNDYSQIETFSTVAEEYQHSPRNELEGFVVGVDNNKEALQQEIITTVEQQLVDDASNEQANLVVANDDSQIEKDSTVAEEYQHSKMNELETLLTHATIVQTVVEEPAEVPNENQEIVDKKDLNEAVAGNFVQAEISSDNTTASASASNVESTQPEVEESTHLENQVGPPEVADKKKLVETVAENVVQAELSGNNSGSAIGTTSSTSASNVESARPEVEKSTLLETKKVGGEVAETPQASWTLPALFLKQFLKGAVVASFGVELDVLARDASDNIKNPDGISSPVAATADKPLPTQKEIQTGTVPASLKGGESVAKDTLTVTSPASESAAVEALNIDSKTSTTSTSSPSVSDTGNDEAPHEMSNASLDLGSLSVREQVGAHVEEEKIGADFSHVALAAEPPNNHEEIPAAAIDPTTADETVVQDSLTATGPDSEGTIVELPIFEIKILSTKSTSPTSSFETGIPGEEPHEISKVSLDLGSLARHEQVKAHSAEVNMGATLSSVFVADVPPVTPQETPTTAAPVTLERTIAVSSPVNGAIFESLVVDTKRASTTSTSSSSSDSDTKPREISTLTLGSGSLSVPEQVETRAEEMEVTSRSLTRSEASQSLESQENSETANVENQQLPCEGQGEKKESVSSFSSSSSNSSATSKESKSRSEQNSNDGFEPSDMLETVSKLQLHQLSPPTSPSATSPITPTDIIVSPYDTVKFNLPLIARTPLGYRQPKPHKPAKLMDKPKSDDGKDSDTAHLKTPLLQTQTTADSPDKANAVQEPTSNSKGKENLPAVTPGIAIDSVLVNGQRISDDVYQNAFVGDQSDLEEPTPEPETNGGTQPAIPEEEAPPTNYRVTEDFTEDVIELQRVERQNASPTTEQTEMAERAIDATYVTNMEVAPSTSVVVVAKNQQEIPAAAPYVTLERHSSGRSSGKKGKKGKTKWSFLSVFSCLVPRGRKAVQAERTIKKADKKKGKKGPPKSNNATVQETGAVVAPHRADEPSMPAGDGFRTQSVQAHNSNEDVYGNAALEQPIAASPSEHAVTVEPRQQYISDDQSEDEYVVVDKDDVSVPAEEEIIVKEESDAIVAATSPVQSDDLGSETESKQQEAVPEKEMHAHSESVNWGHTDTTEVSAVDEQGAEVLQQPTDGPAPSLQSPTKRKHWFATPFKTAADLANDTANIPVSGEKQKQAQRQSDDGAESQQGQDSSPPTIHNEPPATQHVQVPLEASITTTSALQTSKGNDLVTQEAVNNDHREPAGTLILNDGYAKVISLRGSAAEKTLPLSEKPQTVLIIDKREKKRAGDSQNSTPRTSNSSTSSGASSDMPAELVTTMHVSKAAIRTAQGAGRVPDADDVAKRTSAEVPALPVGAKVRRPKQWAGQRSLPRAGDPDVDDEKQEQSLRPRTSSNASSSSTSTDSASTTDSDIRRSARADLTNLTLTTGNQLPESVITAKAGIQTEEIIPLSGKPLATVAVEKHEEKRASDSQTITPRTSSSSTSSGASDNLPAELVTAMHRSKAANRTAVDASGAPDMDKVGKRTSEEMAASSINAKVSRPKQWSGQQSLPRVGDTDVRNDERHELSLRPRTPSNASTSSTLTDSTSTTDNDRRRSAGVNITDLTLTNTPNESQFPELSCQVGASQQVLTADNKYENDSDTSSMTMSVTSWEMSFRQEQDIANIDFDRDEEENTDGDDISYVVVTRPTSRIRHHNKRLPRRHDDIEEDEGTVNESAVVLNKITWLSDDEVLRRMDPLQNASGTRIEVVLTI